MHTFKKHSYLLMFCLTVIAVDARAQKNIWQGDSLTFIKLDGADQNLAKNQDRITDSVWITRGLNRNIFNIVKESSPDNSISPLLTLWAYGTTADIDTLTFRTWYGTHGNNTRSTLGKDMVLFLPYDSIYIGFKMLSFTSGAGNGGFSYIRTTSGYIYDTLNVSNCFSYLSPSGRHTITESGTYNDTLFSSSFEDTLISLNVTINTADASFNRIGNDLIANSPTGTYQWMTCDNGFAAIPMETLQTYTVTALGKYALSVSDNQCVDTSVCYEHLSLSAPRTLDLYSMQVYPNPTTGLIHIAFEQNIDALQVSVHNSLGQKMNSVIEKNLNALSLELPQAAGIYYLKVRTPDQQIKFVQLLKR